MDAGRRVAEAVAMQARLAQWRAEHPQASFDEIEDAVQAEVVRWQAGLVANVIETEASEVAGTAAAPPVCPACGGRLQRSGRRRREVLSRQGQVIPLEREYSVCPACGAGFPPGRDPGTER